MELSVVKPGNKAAGTVAVSEANFAREYNEALVHQVVTAYLSGARQGTRSQKTRSEVAGGDKTDNGGGCQSKDEGDTSDQST